MRDGRLRSGGQIENKTENVINRQSGAAQHPRSNERVVEGTEFDLRQAVGPLVRLTLRPAGVWTTPWQADSLLGAMACAWARFRGEAALRRDLLDPWRASQPPFVISDAFPGSTLPAPAILPLWWDWPPERRKEVKRVRWLSTNDFSRVQRRVQPRLDAPHVTVRDSVRLRNSVSRATDSAGERGELFEVPYSDLSAPDEREAHLTTFARTTGAGAAMLLEALKMLGRTGYGADASAGHGAFDVEPDLLPCPELDDVAGAGRVRRPVDVPAGRQRPRGRVLAGLCQVRKARP